MDRLFNWFEKNRNKETSIILLLKFLYSITYDWIYIIINIVYPFYLSHLFEKENKLFFLVALFIFVILSLWYSFVNTYKNIRHKKFRNTKMILEEFNLAVSTLDNYINNEYSNNGIFEFASDLVTSSIYNTLQKIIECEIRVSIIQQFIDNKKKSCVMLSRRSKLRQKSRKSQRTVKYEKKKDYYYQKILLDNKSDMIVFNEDEINKHFYYQNTDRKSCICQYIAIPDKNSTNDIVFILQLDAMSKNAFGSDRAEINEFYDNYIYPYICLLRHAYNIEKNLKKREDIDNE